MIQILYNNNVKYVIRNIMRSEGFTTKDELRQGGGLSPLLSNKYMDDIIKMCSTKTKKMHVDYNNLQRVEISEGVLADDIVFTTACNKALHENLNLCNKY